MATLFDRGQSMLRRKLATAAGVPAVYARGPVTTPVLVWLGESRSSADDRGPVRLEFRQRDLLTPAAGLTLGGSPALPADGDRITLTLDGRAVTFEVTPAADEKSWRWSDPGETLLRIHVKPVS